MLAVLNWLWESARTELSLVTIKEGNGDLILEGETLMGLGSMKRKMSAKQKSTGTAAGNER